METYKYYGDYEHGRYYANKDIAIYNGLAYAVNIPLEEVDNIKGIIGERPDTSKYWERLIPMQDEIELKLKSKEVEMVTSCIKMALKEGLYDFEVDDIESSDEDMVLLLMKLDVSKQKAEGMVKYC